MTLSRMLMPMVLIVFAVLPASVDAQLRFEVEEYSTPKDAWQTDKFSETKWNLWSTDTDAQKKWSGGVVFQSPLVMAERATPEEGAPPLHTKITGIPTGRYDVQLGGVGRVLGLSLDGKTWQRCRGGRIASGVEIGDGTFELWVDDRFAAEDPEGRGSCYYDYIEFFPRVPVADGVANPGFEVVQDGGAASWGWWSREGKGSALSVTEEKHGGERSLHITHDGERDWALSCGARMEVKAGEEFAVRGWVKGTDNTGVTLAVVGNHDGELVTWELARGGVSGAHDWKEVKGFFAVPEDVNEVYVRFTGAGKTDAYVDDVSLKHETFVPPVMPKVNGWASARAEEPMGRGVVALTTPSGAYVSWRLLRGDPADIAFDVFRQAGAGEPVKVNTVPITDTTDFVDADVPEGDPPFYTLRPAGAAMEAHVPGSARATAGVQGSPYAAIKLDGTDTKFQKVGIVDLNGDGQYDYVIKQPSGNVDPWVKYWYASPETYKLEAYLADGTFLWRHDLGWAIERGIWYSPWIAHDLTGDGKAEVAAKIGEGDPRDQDGKVTGGPEWMVVWDGMTGEEITRVPWPAREGFSSYNLASRNQIAVAYLDGKTPCLLALRGTYSRMKVDAYQLKGGSLDLLWRYDNDEYGGNYRGQGAHFTIAADVDGDGRDEVVLGSAVLDDTGAPLWTTGKGHPDYAYLGDIDPNRPGWEIFYGVETRCRRGGMCLADAATGKLLWQLGQATKHVHGKGICADIDPLVPGLECYGADADGHTLTENRWLYAADGTLLGEGKSMPYSFGVKTAFWDADLQKEIVRGRIYDHGGGVLGDKTEGGVVLVADILGDWREEIITSVPGELRIYSTTIPAADRRVCLMQDRIYRMDVAMNAMGYGQNPMLSTCPSAVSPGLNLSFVVAEDGTSTCRVVVTAPLGSGVRGRVALSGDGSTRVGTDSFAVDVEPAGCAVETVPVASGGPQGGHGFVRAVLTMEDGRTLRGRVPVTVAGGFLKEGIIHQAETIAGQEGGEVRIRDDKPGTMAKAISHWDDEGHALSWSLEAPAGRYTLVFRYSTPKATKRGLAIDGIDRGETVFPSTGGFGDVPYEWEHTTVRGGDGKPLVLTLEAGEHTVRLQNTDGHGLNLDYLALVSVE